MLGINTGCSIGEFLRGTYGLSNEFIAGRITTVILDGEPVDDIDTAILRNGSSVAFSGAMPGLMGAVLKRGSYVASLRQSITHIEDGEAVKQEEGLITVKLFNLVMGELGPDVLRKGIFVSAPELRDFINSQPETFWQGCSGISLNGDTVDTVFLKSSGAFAGDGLVFFSAKARV